MTPSGVAGLLGLTRYTAEEIDAAVAAMRLKGQTIGDLYRGGLAQQVADWIETRRAEARQ